MDLILLIVYFSILIWICLPILFRSNRHFYFFLFLGLNDVIMMIIYSLFSIFPKELWIVSHSLMLLFFDRVYIRKYKKKLLVASVSIPFFAYFSNLFMQTAFVFFAHSIFLFLFSRLLILKYFKLHILNNFYMVLILYELITIYKFIAFEFNLEYRTEIFYVGTLTQIIIGLYLIFIKINTLNIDKLSFLAKDNCMPK